MTDDPVLDPAQTALLPAGFRDILSPNAANEARLIDAMMSTAIGHGYLRVKPPLIEFETSLLQGPGAATAERVLALRRVLILSHLDRLSMRRTTVA